MNVKVLSLSLDNSILNELSALASRVIEYGGLVLKYTVIVPSPKNEKIELSEKVMIYCSSGRNKLAQLIKIYKAAKKLLREEKYDIITAQDQYYLALIGWLLAKKFNLGIEIQIHGWEKFWGPRKWLAKFVLPRATAVRAVSQRLKQQLITQFGVRAERITVAPIFTEINPILNTGEKLKIKNEGLKLKFKNSSKFVFLTVGRLVKVKNVGMQIEAMIEVVKQYPETELWIVGDGKESKKLKACLPACAGGRRQVKSQKFKIKDKVKFFGWQSELSNFYQQADAFLLTSNYEGWGLSVIEAASYGLPIIMTDVGCAGEIIKDGESGLVIPVDDKNKLVEAMTKLIKDPSLRQKLTSGTEVAIAKLPNKEQTLNLYLTSWQKAVSNKLPINSVNSG